MQNALSKCSLCPGATHFLLYTGIASLLTDILCLSVLHALCPLSRLYLHPVPAIEKSKPLRRRNSGAAIQLSKYQGPLAL